MTKREIVLEMVRIAAYQDDAKEMTRLKIEGRIGWESFNHAVSVGHKQRAAGYLMGAQ